jgi:hypothetical protein
MNETSLKAQLNRLAPAARDAHLGDVIEDLITQQNALLAALKAANISGLVLTGVSAVKTLSAR